MCDVNIVFSPALKKSQSEAEVMKQQSEGLAREYDRLLNEHQALQVMSVKYSNGSSQIYSCVYVYIIFVVFLKTNLFFLTPLCS